MAWLAPPWDEGRLLPEGGETGLRLTLIGRARLNLVVGADYKTLNKPTRIHGERPRRRR